MALLEEAGKVARAMDHAQYFDAVWSRPIEDQVVLEATYPPHAETGELGAGQAAQGAHSGHSGEGLEG